MWISDRLGALRVGVCEAAVVCSLQGEVTVRSRHTAQWRARSRGRPRALCRVRRLGCRWELTTASYVFSAVRCPPPRPRKHMIRGACVSHAHNHMRAGGAVGSRMSGAGVRRAIKQRRSTAKGARQEIFSSPPTKPLMKVMAEIAPTSAAFRLLTGEFVLGSPPQVLSFFFVLLALASGFVVQPVRLRHS